MPSGRILVISPSQDLRHSVAFALKAEGYVVSSHAILLAPGEGGAYDCAVIDQWAASSAPRDAVLDFCAHARRVVLLAGNPQPWLTSRVFNVVQTPHLGEPMVAAVRRAVESQAVPATDG